MNRRVVLCENVMVLGGLARMVLLNSEQHTMTNDTL